MTCSPGPWKAERYYQKHSDRLADGWYWGIEDAEFRGYLATLPEDDPEQAESDARLIAAAPTIVALLRRMAEADPMGHDSKENYRCNFCGSEDEDVDTDERIHWDYCPWWQAVSLLLMGERDGHREATPLGRSTDA